MAKLLYIKANPKEDNMSHTFRVSSVFMEEYQKNNPDDEIIVLDLYKENIDFLKADLLGKMFQGEENEAKKHAQLFASADKYVIAAPMWNLSIPAILKAYIDYITYVNITFKYTEAGPVGLLANQNKKALHIVARGGSYSGKSAMFEFGDKYLRGILGFMGILDFETLALQSTAVLSRDALEAKHQTVEQKAIELAGVF